MAENKTDRQTFATKAIKSDINDAVFLGNPLIDNIISSMMAMGTEMWSMRKAQQKKGFDTNTTTRDALFSLIRDWEETWTNDEEPNYVDDCLLDELAAAIFNKRGRPDHPVGGKNDLTIAFGIGLYVFKNCPEQVKCHSDADPDEEESWLDRLKAKPDEWDGFYKWASFR